LWPNPDVLPVGELQLNKLVAQILVKFKPSAVGRVAVAKRIQNVTRVVYQWLTTRLVDGLQHGGAPSAQSKGQLRFVAAE